MRHKQLWQTSQTSQLFCSFFFPQVRKMMKWLASHASKLPVYFKCIFKFWFVLFFCQIHLHLLNISFATYFSSLLLKWLSIHSQSHIWLGFLFCFTWNFHKSFLFYAFKYWLSLYFSKTDIYLKPSINNGETSVECFTIVSASRTVIKRNLIE